MGNILLLEDDKSLNRGISFKLKKEGYNVCTAFNIKEAKDVFENNKVDLIISDVGLPDGSGFDFCEEIRKISNVHIIMLTALDQEIDIVAGYDIGADDYITKPFSVRELMARVKANLRKYEITSNIKKEDEKIEEQEEKKANIIKVNDLELDLDRFEVKVRGEVIDLTLREFEVLKFLAAQPGQVVTREVLLEKVWGYEYYGDIRTVDVTVRRIREKIEKDTSSPKILITKRGVGYYIATK